MLRVGTGFPDPQERRLTIAGAAYMANVEIYVWSRCPFCIRAKQLLDSKGVNYTEYVIDGDEDARDAMVARGSDGRRSVPQIFIDDQHVGGNDDLHRLDARGKLDELLGLSPAGN